MYAVPFLELQADKSQNPFRKLRLGKWDLRYAFFSHKLKCFKQVQTVGVCQDFEDFETLVLSYFAKD